MKRSKIMKGAMLFSLIFMAIIGNLSPKPCIAADVGIIIIANGKTSVNSLSSSELKKIYLGKKTTWAKGEKIIPVILESENVHESFLDKFINKSPVQFNTYWKRLVYIGRGKEPKSFKTQEALIKYIENTNGAVGYISSKVNYDDLLKSSKIKILSIK